MTEASAFFDYDALDDQTRDLVKQRTGEVKRLTKRVAQDIVEIGNVGQDDVPKDDDPQGVAYRSRCCIRSERRTVGQDSSHD